MPHKLDANLLSWASLLEEEAAEQARRTSRLPFIHKHVALMPDAHWGMGATVGSVIPTLGAIIPAAVGVDIGCGMIAVRTSLEGANLPDTLDPMIPVFEERIPAGVGKGHEGEAYRLDDYVPVKHIAETGLLSKAIQQFGSLGSGNHFVEVCLDEGDTVWAVLHSGSRGVGNKLARKHIDAAKGLMKKWYIALEDPELAYLVEQSPEFEAYVADMMWAQDYAYHSRERMMDAALRTLFEHVGRGQEEQRINCHHNYTTKENHFGKNVWLTRKGAIRAQEGDLGVIPGSMGARSYIVRGKGHPASFHSCAHGAGRAMSRKKAKASLSLDDFSAQMGDTSWQRDKAKALLDEAPGAYKDIDVVMEDQKDLVDVLHTLRAVLNYKGTK